MLLQFTKNITIFERYYDSRQNRVPYKASGLHTNFCLPGSVEISYMVALTFVFNSIDDRTSSIWDRFVRSAVSTWFICTISCITYLLHYFSYHMLFPRYLLFCLNNFRKKNAQERKFNELCLKYLQFFLLSQVWIWHVVKQRNKRDYSHNRRKIGLFL